MVDVDDSSLLDWFDGRQPLGAESALKKWNGGNLTDAVVINGSTINIDVVVIIIIIIIRLTLRQSLPNKAGVKCPSVRAYIHMRAYLRPQSFFDFDEIWHVGRCRWVMRDGKQYDPIQCQGHEPLKVGNLAVFKSTISKFDRAGFLIFGLVFVSRDFEVERNASCEESTVSPVLG